MAGDRSEELVERAAKALLAEIVIQTDDAAAASEVKDLAEALAALAPLVHSSGTQQESQTSPGPVGR